MSTSELIVEETDLVPALANGEPDCDPWGGPVQVIVQR